MGESIFNLAMYRDYSMVYRAKFGWITVQGKILHFLVDSHFKTHNQTPADGAKLTIRTDSMNQMHLYNRTYTSIDTQLPCSCLGSGAVPFPLATIVTV